MSNSRAILFIVVLAVVLRAGYALLCYAYLGAGGLMGPDSYGFIQQAQFLADGGSVLQVAHGAQPGIGINNMPIGFLVMGLSLTPGAQPDPLAYVLIQGLVDVGSCVLIGVLAAQVRKDLFLPAALLAAVNPTQIVVSGMFYTDTIFLFFVLAGLVSSAMWLKRPSLGWAAAMGLGWGLALMTRPFVQYWLLVLPVILLVLGLLLYRTGAIRKAGHMAVTLVVVAAIASPILVRNHEQFGTVELTAQKGAHLLYWIVPLVREFKDGTPRAENVARGEALYQGWNGPAPKTPFENSAIMSEIARRELQDLGPAAIVAAWVKGAVMNIIAPASTIASPVSSLPRTGFYDTPGKNLEDKVWNYLFNSDNALYAQILLASAALMPVWIGLALLGLVAGLRQRGEGAAIVAMLALWCGFTLMLNGPVVSPKYRLPLEPAWVTFAAIGLVLAWRWAEGRFLRKRGL